MTVEEEAEGGARGRERSGSALVAEFARRHAVRLALVAGLMAAVFWLRTLNEEPQAGIALLYVVPVLAAGAWFGRVGGLAAGIVAAAFFAAGALVRPDDDVLSATGYRLALFAALGWLVGSLLEQRRALRGALADRDRELDELRALQAALVPPRPPDRPELELASCYVPAEGGVGGDFYIVAAGPGDATVLVVGDVVGRGIDAARHAAYVRTAIATYARFTDDPCRLLELANEALLEQGGDAERFVTAACVRFRPGDEQLTWAAAGHPAPILLDDGVHLNGVRPGLPLGIEPDIDCEMRQTPLRPGGGFLLFTDGLSEARRRAAASARGRGAHVDLFGSERISDLIAEHSGDDPTAIVRALRRAAEQFAGGTLEDDLCLLAARARA